MNLEMLLECKIKGGWNMKKRINFSLRKIYSKFAIMLTLSVLLSPMVVKAEGKSFERISGKNRYATSEAISKYGWEKADYVIIANGENFPDALCSAPLAKKYNAPILLTSKNSLSEEGERELKRLKPSNIILIGGEGSVSSKVEKYISDNFKEAKLERIYGNNRYETSVKIAEKLGFNGEVVIASSMYYADALSIAPIAASKGMPILLTEKDNLSSYAKDYLKDKQVNKSYIVGGKGVISTQIGNELKNPYRLAGDDRFATNIEILKAFQNELDYSNVFTALGNGPKGNEFADALSGAALAAKNKAPMILSSNTLPAGTEEYLNETLSPEAKVYALGGEAVLPDSAVEKINSGIKSYDEDTASISNIDGKGNIKIAGKNSTINGGVIKGNLYIYGDNATINNVKVSGNVFIDPGKDGNASLNNVEASNIRVLSGGEKSIHLKDVKSNNLFLSNDGTSKTRIETTGNTVIKNTNINANGILQISSGSLGNIVLSGQVEVLSSASTAVENIKVVGKDSVINLSGKFNEINVEEGKQIILASGASVNKITSTSNEAKNIEINIPKDAQIKEVNGELKLTGEGASQIKPKDPVPPEGGGVPAVPVVPGDGPKITSVYLKGSDGQTITGTISGSVISINIPQGYDKKITGIVISASNNIQSASAAGQDISKDEMDKIYGSSRQSIDLMTYLRSKGYDAEADGISVSNAKMLNGTTVSLSDGSNNTSYTLSVK